MDKGEKEERGGKRKTEEERQEKTKGR